MLPSALMLPVACKLPVIFVSPKKFTVPVPCGLNSTFPFTSVACITLPSNVILSTIILF